MTIENAEGEQETIDSTPEHPFYVEGLGWVEASSLHAGMTIWFANGTKGTVENISNEGLEDTVTVYNFEVKDFHTYFVGEYCILVHNSCGSTETIDGFLNGEKSFDDALEDYSRIYSDNVNSNKPWSWDADMPGDLTAGQKQKIREYAKNNDMIANVTVTPADGMRYGFADFESAGLVRNTETLPEELWTKSDSEQFNWLNTQIGGKVEGYTWHHTESPGIMQLVPTGIHNSTTHNGGRTSGMWADSPR